MIRRLDTHLFRRYVSSLALIAGAITALFLGMDLLINLNVLANLPSGDDGSRFASILKLYLNKFPQVLNFALPVAALAAALAVAAPMLKRGEFIALGAGGISPRRASAALLLGAFAVGLFDTLVADWVTPHAVARSAAIEDKLQGQIRQGRAWLDDATGTNWFIGEVYLLEGENPGMKRVVAATADTLVYADRADWSDGRWRLSGGILRLRLVGSGRVACDRLNALPLEGPLALALSPKELYRQLLPSYAMRTDELLQRGRAQDFAQVWSRWTRLLLPLIMIVTALPLFVRFVNRDTVVVAILQAALAAAGCAGIIALGGLTADATPLPSWTMVLLAVSVAATPGVVLWRRWSL